MKTVKIYTTPTCSYCKMAKSFFTEHAIAYEEFDVMQNLEARKEMVDKSGQLGVPVIDIDGKIVVGFDRQELSVLLDIQPSKEAVGDPGVK